MGVRVPRSQPGGCYALMGWLNVTVAALEMPPPPPASFAALRMISLPELKVMAAGDANAFMLMIPPPVPVVVRERAT